jgi:hypothetical protein
MLSALLGTIRRTFPKAQVLRLNGWVRLRPASPSFANPALNFATRLKPLGLQEIINHAKLARSLGAK